MKELLYLKDEQLKDLIEKLFISYRETFTDAKKVLDKHSIGLAHHKVIHLLSMYQGISISELLKRLKVTKQSLNRVLNDLIKLEIVTFRKDEQDTRVKHVFLNEKGKKLFNEIFDLQKKRIYNALLKSSSEEVINFDNVLSKIIKSNFIILIFSDASSALFAVVTKKLFSFKYFFTNDLIPSSSSTTSICAINLSINNFT